MEPSSSPTPKSDSVHRNASWGAIISMVLILIMVVVGAFYAWGQRIAQQNAVESSSHVVNETDH